MGQKKKKYFFVKKNGEKLVKKVYMQLKILKKEKG